MPPATDPVFSPTGYTQVSIPSPLHLNEAMWEPYWGPKGASSKAAAVQPPRAQQGITTASDQGPGAP